MPLSLPSINVVLTGASEPIDIQITNSDGIAEDADVIKVDITDLGGNVIVSDDYMAPPVGGSNIIKPVGTVGLYYYNFGAVTTLVDHTADYILRWTAKATSADIPRTILQNIKVVSGSVVYNLPYIRLMIDKSRKLVDPTNDVFLGYTDNQLIMFMEGAMQIINGYQPETITGFTIENFPWTDFRHVANEAALMAGVLSQQLFAIDTDMPNYSDNGTTFVIAHQPQLASLLNQISQRLDRAIPQMKLQFVSTGSIHIEQGPNMRLAMLVNAAPTGALFRNLYFKG